ncbi:MAG: VOC family protein [Acidobacteria bacterium]|nr:VOC family protein [Acidobacteriota bacterium]
MPGRIVGIGGVFFKSADPTALRGWYEKHLAIKSEGEGGAMFHWKSATEPAHDHMTVWSIFPAASNYMSGPVMINYIVEDLDDLLARLSDEGVQVDPKREDCEYGRFAWIYDGDGNKIELWEPPAPTQ